MVKFCRLSRKFIGIGKYGACSSTAEHYTVAVEAYLVGVAQLAERLSVAQKVAGSCPVAHPKRLRDEGVFFYVMVPTAKMLWVSSPFGDVARKPTLAPVPQVQVSGTQEESPICGGSFFT